MDGRQKMTKNQLISSDDMSSMLNENPEFRKAKRKIRPYYDLVTEIINRRVQLGLSQKELAEKAGTHQSRISKIESAEQDVRLSTLIEIAEALETELELRLLPIVEPEYVENISENYFYLGKTKVTTEHYGQIYINTEILSATL
jgi:transcriptional regulator with XRE-family HTH domain